MKNIIFFVLGIFVVSCQQSEQQTEAAQDAEGIPRQAMQFLEEILTDSSQSAFIQDHYYVLSDVTGFLPPTKLEDKSSEAELIAEVLDEKDKGFIRSQLGRQNSFSVAGLKGKGFTIVPLRKLERQQLTSDSLWTYVNRHYENGFYSVSMPVFSSNFQKAYVRLGQLCGPECGGGETRIYEYRHDHWELVDVVEVWVI